MMPEHAGIGVELLTERLKDQIAGVLGCWDRVLIFGTLPKICYAKGMTSYLYAKQVKIFDYPKFAEPFQMCIRDRSCSASSLTIVNLENVIVKPHFFGERSERNGHGRLLDAARECDLQARQVSAVAHE